MVEKNALIAVHTVVATVCIPVKMPEKKLLIPFQIFSKNVLMPDQHSSQLVPN
ncbi:MAG: hypothetical protein LUD82_04420 [Clostridiales bacterium]|nr:hypothetical protein [Clostridiales bacterium]